ncbi:MAG TPA: hypothetical protein VEM15_14910 [Thermodesulfobacteriota bacterium]|nr:hypothetical protein [Thermodesulfobacteriota bacterium]
MKKLLIAGLVVATLIVFSGVTNAQLSWWESGLIQSPVKLTYQKVTKGNATIGTISGKFTGYMVGSSNTAPQLTEEIFLCGTLTVPQVRLALAVWLDFSPDTAFSFISTDHAAEPSAGKTDSESADVIAVGTFHDQTNGVTGPVYLSGTFTLTEDTGDNIIKSVTFKGSVAGGYAQGTGFSNTFSSPSVSAVLQPYTGATPLTCVQGVVEPVI